MISIARKNLFAEKVKFIASITGVGLAILMILTLMGIYFGTIAAARAIPENSQADFWVVERGTNDLYYTASILPSGFENSLEELPGIISAQAIINHTTQIEINGKEVTTAIIGFDYKKDMGGPWKIEQGKSIFNDGEVVVDRSLAKKHHLQLGDQLQIGEQQFEIVGISSETNAFVFQYLFISFEDAKRVFNQSQIVSYYFLKTADKDLSDLQESVATIIPNSEVKTIQAIADGNASVISSSFLPIVGLLVLIGLFVGITVISLTIYSSTMEKTREFGILKALGTKNQKLYSIVFEQTLISSLSGYFLGLLFYAIIQRLAFEFIPSVHFDLAWPFYGYIFALTLVMSILSAFIPVYKVNSIDPAIAFKE